MTVASGGAWRLVAAGAICILAALSGGQTALADTGSCTGSASNIAFGSLTISSLSGATATGTTSESCPGGHTHGINPWAYCNSIGAGSNSVSASNRTMTSGSNAISYNLYTDSAYSNPYTYLGNTVYTYTYNNTSGSVATSTIYAKILSLPAGIPPGTYTDSYTTASQALNNPDGNPSTYSVSETCTGINGANWYNTLAFTVSVTLQASCTVSVSALAFGTVSAPITAAVASTATITALCTSTTPYAIGLDNGQNVTGSQRRMIAGAGQYVSYGLYTDAAHTQPWSSASSASACTNGTGTCALGTGTGASQTITVYGQVPTQTTPVAGTYADSVIVTLTY